MLRLGNIRSVARRTAYHVKIRIEGTNCEQFINICLRRKLDLWGVENRKNCVTLCMTAKAFKKNIRQIVKKTGVKVHIAGRGGFFHELKKYRRRIPLALYGIIGAVMILYCSSFVWHINITGGSESERETALMLLENEGIKLGTQLGDIDTKLLANKLVINLEGVKWATVSKSGTILNIELIEAESYGDKENIITGPRHIVAKKDALIKKIVATGGTAVAEENTVVLAGDIIISGYVYPIDEIYGTEPRAESADGEVIGVVRYSAYMPVETEISVYSLSGNNESSTSFRIFNKEFVFNEG